VDLTETSSAEQAEGAYASGDDVNNQSNYFAAAFNLVDDDVDDELTAQRLYDESDESDYEQNLSDRFTCNVVNESLCPLPSPFKCPDGVSDSKMSPGDLMLLLLKLKHNFTKEATEDVAKLISVLSDSNVAPKSMYNLLKDFDTGRNNVQVHHVCKKCGAYIGIVASKQVCCAMLSCAHKCTLQDSLDGGNFFFHLPLAPQLADLFRNHEVMQYLDRSRWNVASDSISDIVSGSSYRKLQQSDCNSSADLKLTLTFNCDGVPVFKSSSYNIWPILCVVNELPAVVRSDHVLMAGLWFGGGKPDMDVYLEPFVSDCQLLSQSGFVFEHPENRTSCHCIATVVVGVCDSVARPLMQNFKQFNGNYGCGFCFHAGERVEKGKGWTNAYPANDEMILRSEENTAALVAEAYESKTACMGVKGPSLLSLLLVHCCLLLILGCFQSNPHVTCLEHHVVFHS
jgi:hypothetical protein